MPSSTPFSASPATAPMISEAEWIETAAGRATLRRSDRRTLAISVLPDGSVDLVAPRTATLEAILGKVIKRLRWIETQRRGFARMNAVRPALRYVNGASHRYLGRQYRLRISPMRNHRLPSAVGISKSSARTLTRRQSPPPSAIGTASRPPPSSPAGSPAGTTGAATAASRNQNSASAPCPNAGAAPSPTAPSA